MRRLLLSLALAVSLAGACGGADAEEPPASAEPPAPAEPPPAAGLSAGDVAFEVFTSGGLVPIEFALGAFPELVVLGDGTAIRSGVTTLLYPGAALPVLESTQLGASETRELVELARASGLFGPAEANFGFPQVADAPDTTVTTTLDGEQRSVSAYALDIGAGPDSGLTDEQAQTRAALMELISAVRAILDSPERTWAPYVAAAWEIHSLPYTQPADIDPGPAIEWPLEPESLRLDLETGQGCVAVGGEDAAAAVEAAAGATEISRWIVGSETVALVFRPLFPYQHGCG